MFFMSGRKHNGKEVKEMATTTEFAELVKTLKAAGYDVHQVSEPRTWYAVKEGILIAVLHEPRNLWFER